MASLIKTTIQHLQVKPDGEIHPPGLEGKWGNRDIFPVPPEQRTFNIISYFSFWAIAGMSVSSWAFGGSLLTLGLSVGEGIGAGFIAATFVAIFTYTCGYPGASRNLGFTAMARATFGLYGSYLPVMLLVFENVIFFGVNAYFGGLSVVLIIGAMSPNFKTLKNTLPKSAGITTQTLIGYVIYIVVFLALLPIHSSKFRRVAWTGGLAIAAVVLGVFSWAIHANHGKVGHLLETDIKLSGINKSFTMLYAISTAAGSITAYASRMSDWTRFSRTKHTPTIPSIIGPLIFASLTSILGILTTSAVHARYKVVQWNPLALLVYLQETQYTPACRAGTFFAGLALFWSLIVNNLMGKIVPAGMDCAGLWPKFITTRRGALILTVIGIIIQPWRFVTESATFLQVLSAFGVFVAPLTGILAVDYWLVRRRKWKIPDLYKPDGIYWYTWGINWRAIIAFVCSIVWSMPGFVTSINGHPIAVGWTRMFQMSYIMNLAIAIAVFYILSIVFPPEGTGIEESWDDGTPSNELVHSEEKEDPIVAQVEAASNQSVAK